MLGYLVPYNNVEDMIKERRYNQGYLAMIKYEQTGIQLSIMAALHISTYQKNQLLMTMHTAAV